MVRAARISRVGSSGRDVEVRRRYVITDMYGHTKRARR